MRRATTGLLALIVLISCTLSGHQPVDAQAERLATLGKVWLTVKFAHPRVALTERDWDAVLTTALPAVEAALNDRVFEDAVRPCSPRSTIR